MDKIIINTKKGRVIGYNKTTCNVFTSVPYAITERFEDPREVENWDEFDATAKPKNCHQRFEYVDESIEDNNFYYHEFDYYRDSDYVESPMTLNIVTPKDLQKKHPVIVYVHGGSYENGHCEDTPFGDTDEYAKRGVVLVSLGYRLNVFGMFDSGNYGLKDLIFGCKWVKNNIEDYGGDPNNIIIMGQSAGAMGIYSLLLSKKLEGVIKGAVLMSGAGTIPDFAGAATKEDNHWFWLEVQKRCGCENIEQLKKVDHKLLWQSWYDVKQEKGNFHTSIPAIDNDVIPDVPKKVIERKEDLDIPMIIGVTSQDMFPFMIFDLAYSVAKRKVRNKQSNVYCYYFDVELPGNRYKAFHGSDLWYCFGNFEKCWRPMDDKDREISKQMIDYIANFAKNQNPNGQGLENWPAASNSHKKFRWFTKENGDFISPAKARRKLFHSFLFDKGPI